VNPIDPSKVSRPTSRTAPVAISCRGDGSQILALIGSNIEEGIAGFGDSLPDALRDLAKHLEMEVGYDSRGCNPQNQSYLHITRVGEPIWAMTDAEGRIGLRLDCGDGGVIHFNEEQARDVVEALQSQMPDPVNMVMLSGLLLELHRIRQTGETPVQDDMERLYAILDAT
jgi:hypothetical protein